MIGAEGGGRRVDPGPDRAGAGVEGNWMDGIIGDFGEDRLGAAVRLRVGAGAHDA